MGHESLPRVSHKGLYLLAFAPRLMPGKYRVDAVNGVGNFDGRPLCFNHVPSLHKEAALQGSRVLTKSSLLPRFAVMRIDVASNVVAHSVRIRIDAFHGGRPI